MYRKTLAILLALVAATAPRLSAAQLLVSKDGSGGYTTIQGAMNAAGYGDTIRVGPGIYEEGVTFVNGVTLIGSGAAATVIRYGYGFEPVVHASHASAGRIEALTIERTASLLAAPAVLLEFASITIADVAITGAQESGIEIVESTSSPTLERVTIFGNTGHGVWAHGGARAVLVGCDVRGNGGNGVLLTDGARAEVTAIDVADNGAHGVALVDDAVATLDRCQIAGNAGWGVELRDQASADLADCALSGNDGGGVTLLGDAEATVSRCQLTGGAAGAAAGDRATLRVDDSTIRGAAGVGLSGSDSSIGELRRLEIASCGADGVEIASSASWSIDHATLVGNGGAGAVIRGSTVTLTNTIVAYNAGAGISVDRPASDPGDLVLSHNNVWANDDGAYIGISPRTSDVAAPPSFVDLSSGDLSLRPDSACVGRGVWGATIGASPDPSARPETLIEFEPTLRDGPTGLALTGRVRLVTSPFVVETVEIAASYDDDRSSVELVSAIAGTWGWRTSGRVAVDSGALETVFGALRADAACAGVLDGEASWISLAVGGEIAAPLYALASRVSRTWPSTAWTQAFALDVGRTLRAGLSAELIDLSPRSLAVRIGLTLPLTAGDWATTVEYALASDAIVSLDTAWFGSERSLAARVAAYVDSPGHASAQVTLDESAAGLTLDAQARLADGRFADGSLSVAKRLARGRLSALVGLDGAGHARGTVRLEADLGTLGFARSNLLPVPAFGVDPEAPQAGDSIRFDAAASRDPDGEIVDHWWDFGDGAAELGERVVHAYDAPGTYEVALTVADDDGDTATLVVPVVVSSSETAPVAAFTWEPVSASGTYLPRPPRAGDAIRLDASSSYDPADRPLEYHWDFDSDGAFDVARSSAIAELPPFSAGTHPITLRVVNDAGQADAVMHAVVIAEPKAPRADFTASPSVPSVLDPVRFVDRSADVDGAIVAWTWAFGDGAASREREAVHQYAAAGDYVVGLTVVDDDGLSDRFERTISVVRLPEITNVDDVWVLAIGISDYEHVADLAFGRDDAVAVARWAVESGAPPDHVRLLTDRTSPSSDLAGIEVRPATLVNVRESLGWLRRAAAEDDLVMIFFSGHGYQGGDDGTDERDGVDEFFVLVDTLGDAVDDTALRDDEFGRFLDRLASDHVLVFFDGCYSGGLARSLPSGSRPTPGSVDLFSDFSLEGRLVLSASGESQDAFESTDLGHGVFTHFVLDGLRGGADRNGDGHVTVWEVYEHVLAEVPPFVQRERGAEQIPQIVGEGDVRVVVSRTPRTTSAAFSYAPAVPYAGGRIDFRDESSGTVAARTWTFDGTEEATGADPSHTFHQPGVYPVTLTVVDPAGTVSETTSRIPVAPAGRIVARVGEIAVLSLGRLNGVRVGDRFRIVRTPPDASVTLEVTELLDADASACRAADGTDLPEVGETVLPVPPIGP